MTDDVHGILLLDKPLGLTSAAAVARVKRLFGARKVGHMGSLDPLATGLLPIGLGEATKFGAHLLDADKSYRVVVRLGERTPSADRETAVCERAPVPPLDVTGLRAHLASFPKVYAQVPPMHSALKKDGKPLYSMARKGITVERQARQVMIRELRLLAWEAPEFSFEVTVSKGTYIRVLAEDIARQLSTLGHLAALRRLAVAPFETPQMQTLEMLERMDPGQRRGELLPVDAALGGLPSVLVDAQQAFLLRQGGSAATHSGAAETVRIYTGEGEFLGLGAVDPSGRLRPRRLLAATVESP